MVADLHQPLHSVNFYNESFQEGDDTGKKIKIYLSDQDKEVSLHDFWDQGAFRIENSSWFLSRPLNHQNMTALLDRAEGLMKS